MTSVLGPYYSPHHWYPQDEDYIRRLNPAWARIHQPTARAIELVQRNAPNARIMLRSWDIDDHNGDRKRELYADPKGAAHKHVQMWRKKREELEAELRRNGWGYDPRQWYYGLVNEPDPAYVPQVVEYTREAMHMGPPLAMRFGVVCSSVGTFMKPSEGDRGWTQFVPLEQPINEGGHILIVHEYWDPRGPRFGEDAGNLAWRHRIIPLNVPILIGEAGANGFIENRFSAQDDAGWQRFVPDPKPQTFAAQVKEYIEGCDTRVKGVCLYMLDFHDDNWWSFNTGPASEELLAIKDAKPQVPNPYAATPPHTTHIPAVGTGEPPTQPPVVMGGIPETYLWVQAPAGANIRRFPVDGDVMVAVPYGERVRLMQSDWPDGWHSVRYGDHTGWLRSDLLAATKPEPEPMPPASGDNWGRSWPIVLKFEGGLSLDPNDTGNYYQGKLIGTKFGISARSWGGQYDIPNLTQAQALAIYHKHYWLATGCDRLPWPLCLIHFDTAVQHGTSVAILLLNAEPTPEEKYLGLRALRYTHDPKWRTYAVAWGLRVAHLHDIARGK